MVIDPLTDDVITSGYCMAKTGKVSAIILTGGTGSRVKGTAAPKQFISVAGKPLFIHVLEKYEALKEVDEVCLVINQEYRSLYEKILKKHYFKKLSRIVSGGKLRQESLKNGVLALADADHIVIHNGSEPCTSASLIKRCILLAKDKGAAIAFEPSIHTVFIRENNKIKRTLQRESLGYTCAPMVIKGDVLRKALERLDPKVDRQIPMIELMEKNDQPVFLVESHPDNMKVTFDRDLKALEYVLKHEMRRND
jgi:2-C-methyl-D-erythritol 4-phosphate cytidylyltransferase